MNWRPLIVFGVFWAALTGGFLYATPRAMHGFWAGVLLTCVPWLIALAIHTSSPLGRVSNGILAEEWTSKALRRMARRRGAVVDDVSFFECNIDHVVVLDDRVFAVESKWTSVPWTPDDEHFLDAVSQAAYGARKVRLLLRSHGIHQWVRAALAVWGPGARDLSGVEQVGAVLVLVPGLDKASTARLLGGAGDGSPVDPRVRDVLRSYQAERDAYERRTGDAMRRLLAKVR